MWEHDFVTEVEYDEVLATLNNRQEDGWELIGQHRYSQQTDRYTYVYYDLFFVRQKR